MSHEYAAFSHLDYLARYLVEARRVGYHVIGDARELGDEGRNTAAGINQRRVGVNHLLAVVHENGQLSNAVICRLAAGGF
jgi:hypothetical protein